MTGETEGDEFSRLAFSVGNHIGTAVDAAVASLGLPLEERLAIVERAFDADKVRMVEMLGRIIKNLERSAAVAETPQGGLLQ